MLITKENLHEIMPHATQKNIDLFIDPLNAAMEEFEINTPLRIAAFLAQVAHESGSLTYTKELASGDAYEYREDLGNLKSQALTIAHAHGSTTGRFYKGHGLIQLTGYYNHLACSKALGIDCLNKPFLLTEPEGAARSAAWFWYEHNLNELADKGKFNRCTKIINGGFNGKADRDAFYAKAKRVLSC
jgi:putative chitinase